MSTTTNLILIILLTLTTTTINSSPSPPHFLKSTTNHSSTTTTTPQQYFELTHPLPTSITPSVTPPSCSVSLLNHSFGNTYGLPPVTVPYTPPPSTCQWSTAILEFHAQSKGEQYDRIVGVWVNGIEILRTSTAQPTEEGIFWNIRKDVSKYSSVIMKSNVTLTVMLENLINDEFTGVYHVNISLLFYSNGQGSVSLPLAVGNGGTEILEAYSLTRKLSSVTKHDIKDKLDLPRTVDVLDNVLDNVLTSLYPYNKPADMILPVSAPGGLSDGFWFRVEDELDEKVINVEVSNRTYKAVLELYVSFHGNDEFWYMNPTDEYVEVNHLATGRAHGAYREVLVMIDGELVGGVVPFPVIFTGGINPLFWEPVVSIGAFDLPSYDVDLTPFLGMILDGKSHSIGIRVADGISFWLVDANLHLWLDDSDVQARTLKSVVPSMEIQRKNEFVRLDGEFEIEGERESEVSGWVYSSAGNLRTELTEKLKFKNKLKFKDEGTKKELEHQYKRKTKITITNENGELIESLEMKIEYPLKVFVETKPGSVEDTSVMTTKVEQERSEWFTGGEQSMVLNHKQNCTGVMVVKGNSVLSGSAENHQNYSYNDGLGCYSRTVDVVDGDIVGDDTSSICVAQF